MFIAFAILVLLFGCTASSPVSRDLCFNRPTAPIPKDHLFHTKKAPLLIGHRGQPLKYQENTIDGVTSLLNISADGFEIDTFLTKDNKLVLFHDENLKRLTGKDALIKDMTYDELRTLNLTTTVSYGTRSYSYDQPRKIELLEDLLIQMKGKGLLMYLEMKPGNDPRKTKADTDLSIATGKALAKLIRKLGIEKESFVISFDPVKVWAAKEENPDLTVGLFFTTNDWKRSDSELELRKQQYMSDLPDLGCLSKAPNGTKLMTYLFESGTLFKAINASFMDMSYLVYSNAAYSKSNTYEMLRHNYRSDFSFGAWTVYSMSLTREQQILSAKVIKELYDNGAQRLITDDVPRLREFINIYKGVGNAGRKTQSCYLSIMLMIFGIAAYFKII